MNIDFNNLSETQISLLNSTYSSGLIKIEEDKNILIQPLNVDTKNLKEQIQLGLLQSIAKQIEDTPMILTEGIVSLKHSKAFYHGFQAGLIGTTDCEKEVNNVEIFL